MITKTVLEDLTLSSENGYHLQQISDLGYQTRYGVAKVMQSHGAKLGDVFFENRVITFEYRLTGASINEFIERRNALYKRLRIKQYQPDELNIDLYLVNGQIVELTGVVKDVSAPLTVDNINGGNVNFAIETELPFFLSKQIYTVTVPISIGGGAAIPAAIPMDMTTGAATGTTLVANGGTTFAFPKIYLYGPLTNPVLTNETLDKELAIDATIADGDYYVIDTYDHIVLDNTGNNKRDKMTGDFLVIDPGENQFSLLTDTSEAGYVRLEYQYPYISL